MNVIRSDIDKRCLVPLEKYNLEKTKELFSNDVTFIVYLIDKKGLICGASNQETIEQLKSGFFSKLHCYFLDHFPDSNEVFSIFNETPLLGRIAVFVNGSFYQEYRDLDVPYLAKSVVKNIIALRYVSTFKKELLVYFKQRHWKNILVFGDQRIVSYLQKNLADISFSIGSALTDKITAKYDIGLDFKYGYHSLRFGHKFNSFPILNFSKIVTPIAVNALIKRCNKRNIQLQLCCDKGFNGFHCLTKDEENLAKNPTSFEDMVVEKQKVKSLAITSDDCYFVDNREFAKSSSFFDDFTIIQGDCSTPYLHVKNGIRYSGEYPENYKSEVHCFGPCNVFGLAVSDSGTFESQLQKMKNENGELCKVVNHGTLIGKNLLNSAITALNTPLRTGDTVFLLFVEDPQLENANWPCDFTANIIDKYRDGKERIFYDRPGHPNRLGNAIFAKYLEDLPKTNIDDHQKRKPLMALRDKKEEIDNLGIFNPNLYSHLIRLEPLKKVLSKYPKIGSITIYASPFTKGHEYLVEQALKEVDALVVFVVADFYHDYLCYDRLQIVKDNLKKYKNVFVLPSEAYFSSKQYFPEYASRDPNSSPTSKTEQMEFVFAHYLAKFLNIKYRFLGEEKADKLTAKYNVLVRKICKKELINLKIIPRLQKEGVDVSASAARKAIAEKDYKTMKKLLPIETINYIKNNF
jgi:hypothetical protein